ncbi:MAG: CBS domain-containing protein [Acidimicrobiales bacterium]
MRTVRDLMTSELLTIDKHNVVGEVRDLMLESGVHCVPVVDDERRPVGVVSSWDLVEEYAPAEGIMNAMTDRVVTVGPDEPVSLAAGIMMTNWIHHLVVVDDAGRVEGILSSFDLIGLVAEEAVG